MPVSSDRGSENRTAYLLGSSEDMFVNHFALGFVGDRFRSGPAYIVERSLWSLLNVKID